MERPEPGARLRAMRDSLDVSQRLLAEQSGVDQSDISRIERGGDVRWSTLKRLFGALGCECELVVGPADEDAEDFLREKMQKRKDRMERGRFARW